MEEPTPAAPPPSFKPTSRHIPTAYPEFPQHDQDSLVSQLDPLLQSLDSHDTFSPQFTSRVEDTGIGHLLQTGNSFSQRNDQPRFQEIRSHMGAALQQTPKPTFRSGGQFGILMPRSHILDRTPPHHEAIKRIQHDDTPLQKTEQAGEKKEGHFANMKNVPNPPDLEAWRERLFHANDVITMSEDEFQTYFPHVDNIYSHRSTQRYKRKPFVSHYWDCRLKGRPPGTPKSDDPNKRKRKRNARERDLCDVKIKITEYFPGARTFIGHEFEDGTATTSEVNGLYSTAEPTHLSNRQRTQPYGMTVPESGIPGSNDEKYYTIQRVNGNGGNGKGDGVAGPHKHNLEESDRVKKNSIQRNMMKEEKEKKKSQKTYHKRATGAALVTVKKHAKEHDLKLYGSCFCPFVQRVWIALEAKGISYQYIEVDPYKKPESLLEVNPRGLVPALRHGDWATHESTVIMEYLEDVHEGEPLLPANDPKSRADCRLWTDHVNRNVIPAFYHYLQEQDASKQIEFATELRTEIAKLVDAAHRTGPFFLGSKLSFVDIQIAPWLIRMRKVLKPYRGWPDPEEGSRWAKWVEAVENDANVKATTSTDDLYLDSYERYAENRPNTSELAKAVNSGKGLP